MNPYLRVSIYAFIGVTLLSIFFLGDIIIFYRQLAHDHTPTKKTEFILENELCEGNIPAIKRWLDRKCDPNATIWNGHTLLTFITSWPKCTKNISEMVNFLISHGADIHKRNQSGTPPLIAAASGGRFDVIKLYMQYGADVNVLDARGYNALMRFPKSGRKDTFLRTKFLLEIGVNPSHVAPDGHSAQRWIEKKRYPEAYALVLEARQKSLHMEHR